MATDLNQFILRSKSDNNIINKKHSESDNKLLDCQITDFVDNHFRGDV